MILSFAVEPAQVGKGTWVRIYEDGGTRPIAESVSYATAVTGGAATIKHGALLSPGLGGGTYKVIVMVGRASGSAGQITWEFVDALPLVVGPAPVVTTTTAAPVTTLPVTVPPTLPPTTPPPTVPTNTIDCSSCPPGVAGLQCRLQCQAIPPASTPGAGG